MRWHGSRHKSEKQTSVPAVPAEFSKSLYTPAHARTRTPKKVCVCAACQPAQTELSRRTMRLRVCGRRHKPARTSRHAAQARGRLTGCEGCASLPHMLEKAPEPVVAPARELKPLHIPARGDARCHCGLCRNWTEGALTGAGIVDDNGAVHRLTFCSPPPAQDDATRGLDLNRHEPAPLKSTSPAVWSLVMKDMVERDIGGAQKYGTRLQAHNGRDPLVDAYQEALDLAVYLRQAIYEKSGK